MGSGLIIAQPQHSYDSNVWHLGTGVSLQWCALCMLDMSAAFDVVDHDHGILLSKLKLYRFDAQASKWKENYLAGRSQILVTLPVCQCWCPPGVNTWTFILCTLHQCPPSDSSLVSAYFPLWAVWWTPTYSAVRVLTNPFVISTLRDMYLLFWSEVSNSGHYICKNQILGKLLVQLCSLETRLFRAKASWSRMLQPWSSTSSIQAVFELAHRLLLKLSLLFCTFVVFFSTAGKSVDTSYCPTKYLRIESLTK